jgi:hypothetical protein
MQIERKTAGVHARSKMRFALNICEQCGLPLKFTQKAGKNGELKWFPTNPDGSDHWDACSRVKAQRAGLINPDGTPNIEAMARRHPPGWTKTRREITHVWSGDIPPWDESLGEYRDFTETEKAQGLVCQPLQRKKTHSQVMR